MHNGPEVYGVLLGMIGVGSILGSLALNGLKARLGPDRLAALGTVGTILALALYGAARHPAIAGVASLVAGVSWITMMTTLFVSAQVALPEWVRGRGLAIFLTAFFGAMTIGSAVWGKVASVEGLSTALYVAAAGAAVGMIADASLAAAGGSRARPNAFDALAHAGVRAAGRGRGRADLGDRRIQDRPGRTGAAFLAVMQEIGLERKRDGAYAWGVFEDTANARPDGRDIPDSVVARTQAPAHAGDDSRPDD